MKKFLSILLSVVMLASTCAVLASAEVIYEDDFSGDDFNFYDHDTGEGFWFTNAESGQSGMGRFEIEDGKITGFGDALNGFSQYAFRTEDPGKSFTAKYPNMTEFTEWIDLWVENDGTEGTFATGLVFVDSTGLDTGYTSESTYYRLKYIALEEETGKMAVVRLWGYSPYRDTRPEEIKEELGDHVYGELSFPEYIRYNELSGCDAGFNMGADPVRIGIRYGKGNITGYANGKIVGSYEFSTIGESYLPVVWFENNQCEVAYDNYVLATYDHNVKKATRLDNYELREGKITYIDTNGEELGKDVALEDDEITLTAPSYSAKRLVRWEKMYIDGKEVTDFEKASLYYGIELGSDLNAEGFKFTMPDADVKFVATYENTYMVGIADSDFMEAYAEGETVTLTAEDKDAEFEGWKIVSGEVEIADLTQKTITFTMPASDIVLEAVYKGSGLAGDMNGDGKLNARDVTALMKAIVNKDDSNMAGDMNGDGKLNARDVTALMKAIIEKK